LGTQFAMEMWFLVYVVKKKKLADQPEQQTRIVFFDASEQKLAVKICNFLPMWLLKKLNFTY
jgi:hypothetical protein